VENCKFIWQNVATHKNIKNNASVNYSTLLTYHETEGVK